MYKKDLKTVKAFLVGVVCASLAETRKKGEADRASKGRLQATAHPISLQVLADMLNVSTRTACKLRKLAHNEQYINSRLSLPKIVNWTPKDLKELKRQDLNKVPVLLEDSTQDVVSMDRIRYKKGNLFLQQPNNVEPLIPLKHR